MISMRRVVGHILQFAVEPTRTNEDFPARDLAQSSDGLRQLALAVAGDACDAQDFAGVDLQRDPVECREALVVLRVQITHVKQHLLAYLRGDLGLEGRLVDLEQHRAPDHHSGQFSLADGGRVDRGLDLAASQHSHPIREAGDFIQLMRDEDNRLVAAFAPHGRLLDHLSQRVAQIIRFLRRQHGCGFVQDQDIGVAVEHLEDLDPLLFADTELPDIGVGIDGHLVACAQFKQFLCGALHVEAKGRLLQPQDDVFGHGLRFHELEVLVHHAHAQPDGVVGGADGDLLAVQPDLACFGLIQAGQRVHQGGLAGAVFAQQRVDLAGSYLEVDRVVGQHAGELLRDAAHFDGQRDCAHASPVSLTCYGIGRLDWLKEKARECGFEEVLFGFRAGQACGWVS